MKRVLPGIAACALIGATACHAEDLRVLFVAGPDSHGYGAHDFPGGCRYLASCLNKAQLGIHAEVVEGGWPEDPKILDGANALIIYSDGLHKHILSKAHVPVIDALRARGAGFGFLHYACAVEKDGLGPNMLRWMGGYYEPHWSVNPFWTADFKHLPSHPVTRGVQPFQIRDEWYYHMRFREEMKDVSPLLTAVPPEATRQGKDGPHSGNPHVRARSGMPEHVAWAAAGENGARGFGLTGLHDYWNIGHPALRKLVLNASVWLAGGEVPEEGVPVKRVTLEELVQANPAKPNSHWMNSQNGQSWRQLVETWNQGLNQESPNPEHRTPNTEH